MVWESSGFFISSKKKNIELAPEKPVDLYVGIMGDTAKAKAYKLVYNLRMAGYIVETDYMNRSVKAQMKYANKLNARYTIIIGENELETNTGRIKKYGNRRADGTCA